MPSALTVPAQAAAAWPVDGAGLLLLVDGHPSGLVLAGGEDVAAHRRDDVHLGRVADCRGQVPGERDDGDVAVVVVEDLVDVDGGDAVLIGGGGEVGVGVAGGVDAGQAGVVPPGGVDEGIGARGTGGGDGRRVVAAGLHGADGVQDDGDVPAGVGGAGEVGAAGAGDGEQRQQGDGEHDGGDDADRLGDHIGEKEALAATSAQRRDGFLHRRCADRVSGASFCRVEGSTPGGPRLRGGAPDVQPEPSSRRRGTAPLPVVLDRRHRGRDGGRWR